MRITSLVSFFFSANLVCKALMAANVNNTAASNPARSTVCLALKVSIDSSKSRGRTLGFQLPSAFWQKT